MNNSSETNNKNNNNNNDNDDKKENTDDILDVIYDYAGNGDDELTLRFGKKDYSKKKIFLCFFCF